MKFLGIQQVGLLCQWITNFDSAIAQLRYEHSVPAWKDDAQCRRKLAQQLKGDTSLEWIVESRSFATYQELQREIYKTARNRENNIEINKGKTRVRSALTVKDQEQVIETETMNTAEALLHLADNVTAINLTRVEGDLWKQLPSDVKKV